MGSVIFEGGKGRWRRGEGDGGYGVFIVVLLR